MLTSGVERPGGMSVSIKSIAWILWIAIAFVAVANYLDLYMDPDAGDSLETARYLVESGIWSADRQLTIDDHSNHFLWVVVISVLTLISSFNPIIVGYIVSGLCLGVTYVVLVTRVPSWLALVYLVTSSSLYLALISYAAIPYAMLWTIFAVLLLGKGKVNWLVVVSVLLAMLRTEAAPIVMLLLCFRVYKTREYDLLAKTAVLITAYFGFRFLYFGELFGDSGTAGYYFEKALSMKGVTIYGMGLGLITLLATQKRWYWVILVLATVAVSIGAPDGHLQISRYYIPITATALVFASYSPKFRMVVLTSIAILWTTVVTGTTVYGIWDPSNYHGIEYRHEISDMVEDYKGLGGVINHVGAEWIYNAPDWRRSWVSGAEESIDPADPRLQEIDLLIILCNHATRCSISLSDYESNWVLHDACGESLRAYVRTESEIYTELSDALDSDFWDTWYDMDNLGPIEGCNVE